MKEMPSLTTKILIEIREEMKGVREEITCVRQEVHATRRELSERIDATNERLDLVARRQTESEVRLSTEIVALGGAVERLTQAYRADRALEGDVADLKQRVSKLERHQA